MYLMQYELTLPADYDMAIIRERVATRGPAMNDFPGLGVKVFAIRERGKWGSPVNQYAPFYFWASVTGMQAFLWGAGFRALSTDFGRPPVCHWTGVTHVKGASYALRPAFASRHAVPVPPDANLEEWIQAAAAAAREYASGVGVHSVAFAVDPLHWQGVWFTLWTAEPSQPAGIVYEILHVAAPGQEQLGALWAG